MATEFMEAKKVVKISKPADLIEIYRGIYQHWAIYVGRGYIVHFGSDSDSDSGSGSGFSSVGSLSAQDKALIKREKLTKVAGSDLCRVNNRLDDKYPARDPELVLSDALLMVGREVEYSVVSCNCEHFVTALRYYKPESGQVDNVALAVNAILRFGSTLVTSIRKKEEESDKTEKKQQQ